MKNASGPWTIPGTAAAALTAPVRAGEPSTDRPSAPGKLRAGLGAVKRVVKGVGLAVGMATMAAPALTSVVGARVTGGDEVYFFWAQSLALVPGLPGKYLRKCFYWMTLKSCALDSDIGFMSYFGDRRCEVGRRVYVGYGVCISLASLGAGALIGSRASLLSGGSQHRLGPDGRLTPFDQSTALRIRVGEETWIGEAAVLLADVGSRCIVAAGGVVSSPVPDGCVVGGNPARFIRKHSDENGQATGVPS